MSDEESFVILGSSPTSSLLLDPSLQMEGPKSDNYQSLKNINQQSQTVDLQQLKSATAEQPVIESLPGSDNKSSNVEKNMSLRSNGSGASGDQPSLAAEFLMGEVQADVLKNSVYSQFPSVSMQACAEDVIKLQNLMTEYIELKLTLSKVNNTMKLFYESSKQWREDAIRDNQQCQQKLQECQTQIEKLQEENLSLKREIKTNEEQLKISEEERQKENDELRQCLSEKISLINNMRVQIEKLERQQLKSFDFLPENGEKEEQPQNHNFIDRIEHEATIKEFERKISELLAENLEFKDMKKTYIEEIDCLKVNCTSNEELLFKTSAEVTELKAKDEKNTEDIAYLRHQVDIYRRDFEMERADREKNAGEKEQLLQDLRSLQRRNQELIEALSEANKAKKAQINTSNTFNTSSTSVVRENQRPVRVLDPTGAAATTSTTATTGSNSAERSCPICSKRFKSLQILQDHVNDCLDKN